MFWDAVVSDKPKTREELSDGHAFVDVRDLADAHVRALETDKAGGERIFSVEGPFVWQEFRTCAITLAELRMIDILLVDIAVGLNLPNRELPPGFSDIDKSVEKVNASKEKGLGIFVPPLKYRSKEETVKDMFERFAQLGF
jgi:nucleoside-diphosphate-sugar epimerase